MATVRHHRYHLNIHKRICRFVHVKMTPKTAINNMPLKKPFTYIRNNVLRSDGIEDIQEFLMNRFDGNKQIIL